MNNYDPFSTIQTRMIGDVYDNKLCHISADKHFDCLDIYKEKEDNHFRCPSTYKDWARYCDAGVRRKMMTDRSQQSRNNLIYTQARLDDYNRRKNQLDFNKISSNIAE